MTILCLLLYGIFWALETLRRDYPAGNLIYRWTLNNAAWHDWYFGGNEKYNPSYPWTSDFVHMAIWGRLLSANLAVCFATGNWWYGLMYIPMGQVFVLLYHYILKDPPDGNFRTYLKGLFYFGNWHKFRN